jgi:predicted metalloprotease with PDZ domain
LPRREDRGLDFTPTWGRTYWGGALFCLLADIEIRKRTGNRKGLEDALRAILAAGGTIETEWPLTKALRIGDEATGVPVLSELYEKMKASPYPVDLNALWKELGVERKEGLIRFNDSAPLGAIRRAITGAKPDSVH